jgi:hypothetical protein
MNYYGINTNPLILLKEEGIAAHDLVYNELGKCVKKVYIDDRIFFIDILESVLTEGETLSGLTDTQLDLFWTLSKNKLNNYNENSHRHNRGRLLS